MLSEKDVATKEYVIQRASETLCEWWTGRGWSENSDDAMRYDHQPDVSKVTGDESATAELLASSNIAQSELANRPDSLH